MRVLAHANPRVLERRLLDEVAEIQREDPLRGVLIVVPTRRLADHLQRRIAGEGARLGVDVLEYRGLAARILEQAGREAPQILSQQLRESLTQTVLDELRDNPWGERVALRPGSRVRLAHALNEMREAGLTAALVLDTLTASDEERALAAVYDRYCRRLERLARKGFVDEAGLVAAALPKAGRFARRYAEILHHGAYDVLGSHLALIGELDGAVPVTFLFPADADGPSIGFVRRHLGVDGVEGIEAGVEPPAVTSRHLQGARAELRYAMRAALAAVTDGTPPEEIAVVARSLTPYLGALDRLIGEERIPIDSSARVPLRRDPAIRDLLAALTIVRDDFPRVATVELLRSPRLRWSALDVEPPSGDAADRASRSAKILGGRGAWTTTLLDWAAGQRERPGGERRLERCRRIAAAVEALHAELADDRPRAWSEHAERLRNRARRLLEGADRAPLSPAWEALYERLDDLARLDTLAGARPVRLDAVVHWLEQAVDSTELPVVDGDGSGIRLLDAMQARGLTFRRVFAIGLNEGQWPRICREDPVLPDAARRRLSEASGRPLADSRDETEQESRLLDLVFGAGSERLDVSWQRADDAGRARAASIALTRLPGGDGDALGRRIDDAQKVPAHPRAWLETLLAETGMLREDERRRLVAFGCSRPETALELLGDGGPELRRGLSMLVATESFAPDRLEFDGRVGGERVAIGPLSAGALDRLGRCPLQFFFDRVLKVRELDDEATLYELEPAAFGSEIHDLFERFYRRVEATGPASVDDETALAWLREAWSETVERERNRLVEELPGLWALYRSAWLGPLERFVVWDLERMRRRDQRIAALEEQVETEVALGDGITQAVRVRLDRRLDGEDGPLIADYKTGRTKLGEKVDLTPMLKGEQMQVPLYWLAAGEAARVELLGVGAHHDPAEVDEADRRAVFDGPRSPELREGLLETLRVLVGLYRDGRFPLRPGRHCGYCPYSDACRSKHPPTLEREDRVEDVLDFRRLQKKSRTRSPTLAKVRR